jgi:hypothetical protein
VIRYRRQFSCTVDPAPPSSIQTPLILQLEISPAGVFPAPLPSIREP